MMKTSHQEATTNRPAIFVVIALVWLTAFSASPRSSQSFAQTWSPYPNASPQGSNASLIQSTGYQLQSVPCEDCDSPVATSLPPLPGVEAFENPAIYDTQWNGELDAGVATGVYSGAYDETGAYLGSTIAPGSMTGAGLASGPWFPNRPHIIPRTVDRLQQRPLFPNRPYLRGALAGGPALERPRTFWLNPFGLQQGVGNFLFRGNQPADTGSLGFPFSLVPSHLADRVPRPYFGHGQNYIQSPHIGMGQPLQGTSWGNRPYSIGVFTGAFLANELNQNIQQGNGLINGFRVGWDFDHYWGTEFRMAFGDTRVDGSSEKVDVRLADIGVVYYPWGDARWRPYTSVGLGVGNFAFQDGTQSVDDFALQIPLSIGVKYAFKPWWNLRLDATDYLSMPSSDLDFMNNVQLTGALEYRFGGRRRSYFPYNPSIHLK